MIDNNILAVKKRIVSACAKSGRRPEEITVIAVSKGRALGQIEEVIKCGITDIGENKVQEALLKFDSLQLIAYSLKLRWHMVGHLQANKAKEAVRIFDLIHSVDSVHLAEEINRQAAKINKIQDVLIEVKTSPESTKFGVPPEGASKLFKEISGLRNVRVKGLMTIAPVVDKAEKSRPYFSALRHLREQINNLKLTAYSLQLSMGMTDDFEVAIEEGATMVRIGRAIFD